MKSYLAVGLVFCLASLCHGNEWPEMSSDYLEKLTDAVKEKLYDKQKIAERIIKEYEASWENEEKNAEVWKKEITKLQANITHHLTELKKAKNDLLTHTKHRCIKLLQDQKQHCLDCVSTQCNAYIEGSCDFEAEAKDILEKIIDYFMELFNIQKSYEKIGDDTELMIEQRTKNLQDSTEKLIYQLGQAKKALDSNVDVESLKYDMDEVRESSKGYIDEISAKIDKSENVIETLLSKDKEFITLFEEEKLRASARNQDEPTIFNKVWSGTKSKVGKAVCFISFGLWLCSEEEENTQHKQPLPPMSGSELMELKDLIKEMKQLPTCAQFQSNISHCLYFVPSCKDQCYNMSVHSVCPRWFTTWNDYKTTWALNRDSLNGIYIELEEAEDLMMTAIKKHNEAVAQVLHEFGWIVDLINPSHPLEHFRITRMKYNPNSFDPDIVNKFRETWVNVKINKTSPIEEIKIEDLVSPHDPEDVAQILVNYIEKIQKNKHMETTKFKDLIKMFTD